MKVLIALACVLCAAPVWADAPQSACDWLRLAAPEAFLGADLAYETRVEKASDAMTLSVCSVTAPEGTSLTLLRRTVPGETRAVSDLVAGYIAEQTALIGADPGLAPRDLGDAALWDGTMRQLAIWSHQGQVLMIFSGFGPQAEAQETALAEAILAAGG